MIDGTSIKERIDKAVKFRAADLGGVESEVEQAIVRSHAALDDDLKDIEKSNGETRMGTKIVGALYAIRGFHRSLVQEITQLQQSHPEQKDQLEGVAGDVNNIIDRVPDDIISRRQDAVQDFESSVIFIGDAAKP